MRRVILIALICVVSIAGIGISSAYLWLKSAYHAPTQSLPQTVLIERGMAASAIGAFLRSQGLIDDARVFRFGYRFFGEGRTLRAGEFEIPAGSSAAEIVRILDEAKQVIHRITIPEGLSSWEIVAIINADPTLTGDPVNAPAEGSMLPETYHFHRGTSRVELADRMQNSMSDALSELWAARVRDLPISSPEDAVILASIIEKETGIASERRHVAGVFVNRLRKGMRLQSDPTVVYGITLGKGALGRGLKRSELDAVTPYNTYKITGLPPSPIANPGRASLQAALNPLETEALYFVADGTGGHAFAKTLKEHNKNVRAWRKIERQRKRQ